MCGADIESQTKRIGIMNGPDEDREYSQAELDNHANQLNENNDAYWESRGYDERPDDWEDLVANNT
jgi:hypothetical protein